VLPAVVLLLFDRWVAVFLASFQDAALMTLLARIPESVELALFFLGGVVFFLAYRATSGECLRADLLGCGIVSASIADISKISSAGCARMRWS
jgi:hypothetical protein